MTYAHYMPVDQVDESASHTDMQGPSSTANQVAGAKTWLNDPTKSLILLWAVALLLYWFLGSFFRRHRS